MKLDMQKIDYFTKHYDKYFPNQNVPFYDSIGRKFLQLITDDVSRLDTDLFTSEFIQKFIDKNLNNPLAAELLIYLNPVHQIRTAIILYELMSQKEIHIKKHCIYCGCELKDSNKNNPNDYIHNVPENASCCGYCNLFVKLNRDWHQLITKPYKYSSLEMMQISIKELERNYEDFQKHYYEAMVTRDNDDHEKKK